MLKQTELKNQWNKEKEKMMKKINNLNMRQNPIKPTIPVTYKDILIGNKELEEEFGETDVKVAVYGGLNVSNNVIEFLKLPSKFRVYENMSITKAKRRIEESAAGERWDIMDRKERENDGQRLTPDELREQKDCEYVER